MTRFLFMKLKPRGLAFCSATTPKIQTLPPHLTQIVTLTLHSHGPHTVSHSSNPKHRSSLSRDSNLEPYHSIKPTPVLTTLTLPHTGPYYLSLFKPKYSQTHIGPHSHSHSNLVPHHSEPQTGPHNRSLTLKPTPVLTVSHSSNPIQSNPNTSPQSLTLQTSHQLTLSLLKPSLSLKPCTAPLLNLITLQNSHHYSNSI